MWFLLFLRLAFAAAPVRALELPPSESCAPWRNLLSDVGLTCGGGGVGVAEVAGEWRLFLRTPQGLRVAVVPRPLTVAARERVVVLAASLLTASPAPRRPGQLAGVAHPSRPLAMPPPRVPAARGGVGPPASAAPVPAARREPPAPPPLRPPPPDLAPSLPSPPAVAAPSAPAVPPAAPAPAPAAVATVAEPAGPPSPPVAAVAVVAPASRAAPVADRTRPAPVARARPAAAARLPAGPLPPVELSAMAAAVVNEHPDLALQVGGELSGRAAIGAAWLGLGAGGYSAASLPGGSLGFARGWVHAGVAVRPAPAWRLRGGAGAGLLRWAIDDQAGAREEWGPSLDVELGAERSLGRWFAVDLGVTGLAHLRSLNLDIAARQPASFSVVAGVGVRVGDSFPMK